jgi:hypothetical protein
MAKALMVSAKRAMGIGKALLGSGGMGRSVGFSPLQKNAVPLRIYLRLSQQS